MAQHLPYELKTAYEQKIIVGVDEVGTGCLAGPVAAAACILPNFLPELWGAFKDSKKYGSLELREMAADHVRRAALSYTVDWRSVDVVNDIGPRWAADAAMAGAVNVTIEKFLTLLGRGERAEQVNRRAILVIVDGTRRLDLKWQQETCKRADSKFMSVAAASILAKVARDRFMVEAGQRDEYAPYGFVNNKGYYGGGRTHVEAISRLGLSPLHRVSLCRTALRNQKLPWPGDLPTVAGSAPASSPQAPAA